MQTQEKTDVKQGLFGCQQDGMIVCFKHLGGYGKAAVERDPDEDYWITPLNVWVVMDDGEKDAWLRDVGEVMKCEVCKTTGGER